MQISSVSSYYPPPPTQQQRAQLFAKADTDGDGALTLDEFKAGRANRAGASADVADASRIEALFESADSDGDGKLTQAELEARLSKFTPQTQSSLLEAQEGLFAKADTAGQLSSLLDELTPSDDEEETTTVSTSALQQLAAYIEQLSSYQSYTASVQSITV